jgi:hypothetical protein
VAATSRGHVDDGIASSQYSPRRETTAGSENTR